MSSIDKIHTDLFSITASLSFCKIAVELIKEDASLYLVTYSISDAIEFIKKKSIEVDELLPQKQHKPFK